MEVRKNIFANLPKSQYLELLPNLGSERAQEVTTLVLSFFAVAIFGFFAINPTLSIIANLKRQLADSEFVSVKLDEKITTLRSLQEKYAVLQNDIPTVLSAIPQNPMVSLFLAQMQSLAQSSHITLVQLQAGQIDFSKTAVQQVTNGKDSYSSFQYTIEANGAYSDVANFIASLGNFDRITTINSLVLTKDPDSTKPAHVSIIGVTYFKQ